MPENLVHPQYDKAITYYVEMPNSVRTSEGAARIVAWTTTPNGLIETDSKAASTYILLAGLVVSIIPGISVAAQTVIALAAEALDSTINQNKPCQTKGFKSYKYYYRDGEVYSDRSSWWLEYRTGRCYTYKHTWGQFVDSGGYIKQYTKDYTPTNGYSAIKVESSQHYLQDSWVKTEASRRYWLGLGPFSECPW